MAILHIVGCGIKMMSHLSTESKASIEQAKIVLFAVSDKLAAEWLRGLNSNAVDLSIHYVRGRDRQLTYDAMVAQVLEALDAYEYVCVVFYGHPAVFVSPAPKMIRLARKRGHQAELLPGISAEDCLYADLVLDPAQDGCQTYEATDFLIRPRVWDVHSVLILWQVGVIGHMTAPNEPISDVGIRLLVEKLCQHYPETHLVTIYEAAQFVITEPRIEQVELGQLAQAQLTQISTLYVPPVNKAVFDQTILERLGLKSKGERN